VLATINTTDFLYTCPGHLSDQGFASLVRDSPSPNVTLTSEEIRKVKEEWEETQKKKGEKEKQKEKEQKEKEEKGKTDDIGTKPVAASRPGPATLTPTHERYMLHRDFFASWSPFLL
jgi:cobalamin-dependent methionine synthase I